MELILGLLTMVVVASATLACVVVGMILIRLVQVIFAIAW